MTNDLTFTGENPVLINFNGDTSDVYAPLRTSSCDINIVSKDLLTDIYTSEKDKVRVSIEDENGDTIWEGYMTPNTYSQELTQNLDEISMTCIDPISMMKYIKIDSLLERPNILEYRTLLGLALNQVKLTGNELCVERCVSYGGVYDGTNGLLDLSIQVSNFWDEGGEPETVYSMIEEMLRPFCMTLVYGDGAFWIYDMNNITGTRVFDIYKIGDDGTLTFSRMTTESTDIYTHGTDWNDSNTSTPTLEINETYDKITGVASSSIPEYNSSAFDRVSYTDRDKYDAGWLNVERNKVKGYTAPYTQETKPYWYFLWNGVYTNADYKLISNGGYVNGWLNINGAYRYYTDDAGTDSHMDDYGSILNFYGGAANATATGKEQVDERSVEVSKRITAYAPDNGLAPEFLEKDDFKWSFDDNYSVVSEGTVEDPELTFASTYTAEKYGVKTDMQESSRVVYHQDYPNMQLIQGDQQTIEISLKHSYSRTGINTDINLYSNSLTDNNKFLEVSDGDGGVNYLLMTCDLWYIPYWWLNSNVKVQRPWFSQTPKWDRRRIDLYVKNSDGTIYQFNGKEWIQSTAVSADNCFYLCKLMNGERLFSTDMSYDMIECSDGERYSLTDEQITVRLNKSGEVVTSGGTSSTTYKRYADISNDWVKYISSCQAGELKLYLPDMDAVNVSVITDIYNSTFLGMTGDYNSSYNYSHTFVYQFKGSVERKDPEGGDSYWYDISNTEMRTMSPRCSYIPPCADYVKAEHLDIEIEVSVPESNLGQMFNQSDIEYTLDKSKGYLEEYEGPTFRINTKNQLVKSSNSYLIYKDRLCEGDEFVFHDNLNARPECYTVQAYYNWLGTVRKNYTKVLKPAEKTDSLHKFSNLMAVIDSPETGDNQLNVISDSWDVKTNRHTVKAVECQDMRVDTVDSFATVEIPRKARNERYNLPTAKKS